VILMVRCWNGYLSGLPTGNNMSLLMVLNPSGFGLSLACPGHCLFFLIINNIGIGVSSTLSLFVTQSDKKGLIAFPIV